MTKLLQLLTVGFSRLVFEASRSPIMTLIALSLLAVVTLLNLFAGVVSVTTILVSLGLFGRQPVRSGTDYRTVESEAVRQPPG